MPSNDENFKQQRTRKMQMRKEYIPKMHYEKIYCLQRRKFQTNDAKSDCRREQDYISRTSLCGTQLVRKYNPVLVVKRDEHGLKKETS